MSLTRSLALGCMHRDGTGPREAAKSIAPTQGLNLVLPYIMSSRSSVGTRMYRARAAGNSSRACVKQHFRFHGVADCGHGLCSRCHNDFRPFLLRFLLEDHLKTCATRSVSFCSAGSDPLNCTQMRDHTAGAFIVDA